MHRISWNQVEFAQANNETDVERELDRLETRFRSTTPTLVSVERMPSGDCLSIGLGLERSVLNFVRGDKEPPYISSVDEAEAGDDTIEFDFGGSTSEYLLRSSVPIKAARAAMSYFCRTGELTNAIGWEEV